MIKNKVFNMLRERFDILFSTIPKNKWHLFHKKSVENFIYYLPKIKGVSEKKEIETVLIQYFEYIELIHAEEIATADSIELFNKYLYPMAQKFEWRQGFVAISSLKGMFFIVPILFIFFFFAYKLNTYLFVTLALLVFLYFINAVFKALKKKVYGIGY